MTALDDAPAPVYVDTLEVRDFKRLHAVTIHADGPRTILLTGHNRQGKSSILDSLWAAMRWADVSKKTPNPVRDGADQAHIRVTLTNGLTATRVIDPDGTTKLTVTGEDGKPKKSPQRVLDDLVGALTFDPTKFALASEREQYAMLVEAIDWPFDLAEFDRKRAEKFAERTAAGRRAKELAAIAANAPAIPDNTPDVEVSAADLAGQIADAQILNASIRDHDERLRRAEDRLTAARAEFEEAQAVVRELTAAAFALPDPVDITDLTVQIGAVETVNAHVRARRAHEQDVAAAAAAHAEWERLDLDVKMLDETKQTAINEAQLPVSDLSFDEAGRVTYRGQTLDQCSGAERIEVSVAVGLALNPGMPVLRITDAAILDSDSRQALTRMAEKHGAQLWVEVVTDGDDLPGSITIENGRIREDITL